MRWVRGCRLWEVGEDVRRCLVGSCFGFSGDYLWSSMVLLGDLGCLAFAS